MLDDHLIIGDPLGAGSADIILAEHFEHTGTGLTNDQSHGVQSQHHKGDNDLETEEAAPAVGHVLIKHEHEKNDNQWPCDEDGNAPDDQREADDEVIEKLVLVERCNDAQNDTDD